MLLTQFTTESKDFKVLPAIRAGKSFCKEFFVSANEQQVDLNCVKMLYRHSLRANSPLTKNKTKQICQVLEVLSDI